MDKHKILSGMIMTLILAFSLFFSGCEQQMSSSGVDTEKQILASTTYREKWIVNTEPPGCRIYIQDSLIGDSPIELTVNGGEAILVKSGSYHYVYNYVWDSWSGETRGGERVRISPTNWSPARWVPKSNGYWTIKAFKEGYETNKTTITCGDSIFFEAFKGIESHNVPEQVVGTRHLLLELRPLSLVSKTEEAYRSGREYQDEQRRRMYEEAKAEYEAALEAYNNALKEYNDAKILANAPKSYPHPALGVLMESIGEPSMLAEKERVLEIARQRLERAKAKMNHAEW